MDKFTPGQISTEFVRPVWLPIRGTAAGSFSSGIMAHGSDRGRDVARSVLPGHEITEDADPNTTEGLKAWAHSIHAEFVADALAEKLVQGGYDRVSMATELTVDVLRNDFAVRRGHADAFVSAAKAVQVALGT